MKIEVLYHGRCSGQFKPQYVGTDYFCFIHECEGQPKAAFARITKVLIDNDGRVIFNLHCEGCGVRDALKTHPLLWLPNRPKETPLKQLFQLSPKLRQCIGKHWWDNH